MSDNSNTPSNIPPTGTGVSGTPTPENPGANDAATPPSNGQGTPSTATASTEQTAPVEKKQTETDAVPDMLDDAGETTDEASADTLGAPEAYNFDGIEGIEQPIETSHPMMDAFTKTARELNLSNEAARTLYARMVPVLQGQTERNVALVRQGGYEATKQDPELGGANFESAIKTAKVGYQDKRFISDGLRDLLKRSGLNNHPEVVRLCYRLGKLTGEGSFGKPSPAKLDPNDPRLLYPNTKNINP